jgi:hypothetical protein
LAKLSIERNLADPGALAASILASLVDERSYSDDCRRDEYREKCAKEGFHVRGMGLTRHKLSHGSGERKWQLLEAH